TTIAAVRDTWVKEGTLSPVAIREARRLFGRPCDYHHVQARLVENLVFQSSLLDWIRNQDPNISLRFHVIGTALLSALVSASSIPFRVAVETAMKFGARWHETLRETSDSKGGEDANWAVFRSIRRLMEGSSSAAMSVLPEDLPIPEAPVRPFWYS